MPHQVRMPRYISHRNSSSWDTIIQGIIGGGKWREENTYYGITTEERADEVRRKLRTAAKHQGAASKVFYYSCGGCPDGGAECRHHVSFTLYPIEEARQYRAQQQRGNSVSYRK